MIFTTSTYLNSVLNPEQKKRSPGDLVIFQIFLDQKLLFFFKALYDFYHCMERNTKNFPFRYQKTNTAEGVFFSFGCWHFFS